MRERERQADRQRERKRDREKRGERGEREKNSPGKRNLSRITYLFNFNSLSSKYLLIFLFLSSLFSSVTSR